MELDEAKTKFSTYIKTEDRLKKIVMKAAPNMDLNDIITELDEHNIKTSECVPWRGRFPNTRSFLLMIPYETQINDIKTIDKLNNVVVSWEKYIKKTIWTQYHRCQAFGHGAATCHRPPRCVKCLISHHIKNCNITTRWNHGHFF